MPILKDIRERYAGPHIRGQKGESFPGPSLQEGPMKAGNNYVYPKYNQSKPNFNLN